MIEEWWRHESTRTRSERAHGERAFPVRKLAPGIHANGPALYESDSTRIAEFVRYADEERGALVRLVLPNAASIVRHRIIRDSIERAGGKVFTIPRGVMDAADIDQRSIEVVATKRSLTLFRADEQVVKALVTHRGEMVWDSYWGTRYSYKQREAYFLAGYDQNEPGLSYFFCELPPGVVPKTVDEAYESLKPDSVRKAEQLGYKVKRQGDMFFIRMKDYQPGDHDILNEPRLYRSNHVADEGVTILTKTAGKRLLYVRGTIKHVPFGRRPDHKPLKLGTKYWWLCVRNTVPVNG